jgi:hypothetical protein
MEDPPPSGRERPPRVRPEKSVNLADRDVAPLVRGLIDAADKLAKGAD